MAKMPGPFNQDKILIRFENKDNGEYHRVHVIGYSMAVCMRGYGTFSEDNT